MSAQSVSKAASADEQHTRALAEAKRSNCPYDQALFLVRGGSNAAWYAGARTTVETEQDDRERTAQRILAALPKDLTRAQALEVVIDAMREANEPTLAERMERGSIHREFAAFCEHVRAVVDFAGGKQ